METKTCSLLLLLFFGLTTLAKPPLSAADANSRDDVKTLRPPNIVIIMADDMGYSDLGCYGGAIETPNSFSL